MNIDQIKITVANNQILDELAEAIEWQPETMHRGHAFLSGSVSNKNAADVGKLLEQQSLQHLTHTLIFTYTPESFNWQKTFVILFKAGKNIEENEITLPEAKPAEDNEPAEEEQEPEQDIAQLMKQEVQKWSKQDDEANGTNPTFTADDLKTLSDALGYTIEEIKRIEEKPNFKNGHITALMRRRNRDLANKVNKLLAASDIDFEAIVDDLPF